MRKPIHIKLRLSAPVTAAILDMVVLPRSTFGVVVARELRLALELLPDKLTPQLSIEPLDCIHHFWIEPDDYRSIEGIVDRSSLNISGAIDWVLRTALISVLPDKLTSEATVEAENLNLSGNDDDVILEIGHFRTKHRKSGKYYYWQYYLKCGKKHDLYLGTSRDKAIAKARAIGIPPDANPKYRRR